jgi:hypothetical protein
MDKCTCGGSLKREGGRLAEALAGGKSHEVHEFYRCVECGLLWDNIEESGLGGHGNVWVKAEDQRPKK